MSIVNVTFWCYTGICPIPNSEPENKRTMTYISRGQGTGEIRVVLQDVEPSRYKLVLTLVGDLTQVDKSSAKIEGSTLHCKVLVDHLSDAKRKRVIEKAHEQITALVSHKARTPEDDVTPRRRKKAGKPAANETDLVAAGVRVGDAYVNDPRRRR